MMKKLLYLLTALATLTSTSSAVPTDTTQNTNTENLYPVSAIVTEINEKDDIVTVEDTSGNLWDFYGVEDWTVGDGCAMIMDDNGTENVEDDRIVSTKYYENNWVTAYCYSDLEIVDWNTDGEELAFTLSDDTELYAYKSQEIYKEKAFVPVNK